MKSLTIRCLANEVVVGLMSVTLQQPNGERSHRSRNKVHDLETW